MAVVVFWISVPGIDRPGPLLSRAARRLDRCRVSPDGPRSVSEYSTV